MLDTTGAPAAALPDLRAPGPSPEHGGIPWLREARRMMVAGHAGLCGRRELFHVLGRMNRRAPWTVPWCGLFVAHCLRTADPRIEVPFLPARARPWRRWGEETRPQLGAVMLFWHYHRGSPFGHAAFYWAEDRDAYHVLGGNQGHRVCIQRYPKERFVTARWPGSVPEVGLTRIAPSHAARPFG